MEEINENFIQCGACSTEYDSDKRLPRVLNCLHTCCTSCIRDMVERKETRSVECPQCNIVYDNVTDIESELPIDCASRNFVEFLRVQRKPDEIPCTDCPDDEFAVMFCKDCYSFLCRLCADAHKRTQITRKHATTTIEEMQTYGMNEFHKKDTCTKQGHGDQVYTFYCDRRGCDKPVCTLCAVCDHNQTNGHLIRNLSDVFEDSKAVVQSVVRELNTKERPVTESIEILQRLLDDIEEKETEIVDDIDEIFNKLVTIVNSRREQLQKEVENHCSTKKRDLQNKLQYLKSYATNVQTAMEFVSRAVSYSSATEFLLTKSIALKRLLELKNLTFTAPSKEDVTVKFFKGISDDSFIQLVNSIGSVTSRDQPPPPIPQPLTLATSIEPEVTRLDEPEKLPRQPVPMQAVPVENVTVPNDKTAFQRRDSYPNKKNDRHPYERQNSMPGMNQGLKDAIISARNEIFGRQTRFSSTSSINGYGPESPPMKDEKVSAFGKTNFTSKIHLNAQYLCFPVQSHSFTCTHVACLSDGLIKL